jgi:hypothetical protein
MKKEDVAQLNMTHANQIQEYQKDLQESQGTVIRMQVQVQTLQDALLHLYNNKT